jgi:hypothetical protein
VIALLSLARIFYFQSSVSRQQFSPKPKATCLGVPHVLPPELGSDGVGGARGLWDALRAGDSPAGAGLRVRAGLGVGLGKIAKPSDQKIWI